MEDMNNGELQPGKKWPQYLAASLATLGTICAGTVMGWSSPAMPHLQASGVTSTQISWIVSLAPLGALLGALPAGHIANSIGRKTLLLYLTVPYLIGWSLIISAGDLVALVFIGRFLCGTAMGAGSVITPIYCEEIAEVNIRGAIGVFFDLQVGNGILLVYIIGSYVSYNWLCIACAIFPVVFFVTFYWMPESPIYLIANGKSQEAENSLSWLRGAKHIPDYDIKPELDTIHKLVSQTNKSQTVSNDTNNQLFSILKLIPNCLLFCKTSATAKAVKIVAFLMIFRQMSGINAIIYYTVNIFEEAGTSLSPFTSTIIVGVSQVIFTYLSSVLVERTGRRVLLLLSEITIAICQIVLAVYFYLKQQQVNVKSFGWLPLVCITVYIGVFNLGFGPLPWVMMAELVPNKSKSWASGLCVSVNWISVFVITNVFQSMIQHLGPVITFSIFGVLCVIGTIVVALIVPETKGKTREQIQQELKGSRLT